MTQTKPTPIQAVKGMQDFLPEQTAIWEQLEDTVRSWMRSYGYQNIRTPIVESTALFTRGLGQVTDIVEKEMYSFTDSMNGDALTLRPENTAGVVRACIENSLTYDGAKRLWYMGPMFRHEKPQRGRYRQFHQIGAEAVGFAGPDVDAELIVMCQRLWDDLGLQQVRLEINSIGDADERATHRQQLIAYFEGHSALLDEDAKRRLHSNPLRILDSKNPTMQVMIDAAPKLMDFLGDDSRAHFEGVLSLLRHANVPYKINPRLVRGMDYYNRTVFEWVTDLLGSQGTICGGGRYDPLAQMYGGKPTPACGFAMGVERLIDIWQQSGQGPIKPETDVYLIHQGALALPVAFVCAEELRANGFNVIFNGNGGSFKAQFKRADASGAQFAVVIGDDEVAKQQAVIKPLRDNNANKSAGADPAPQEQIHVSLGALSQELGKMLLASM